MNEESDLYHAYLLRLWRAQSQGKTHWRASLESPHTGERQLFASLEQCLAYLSEQFGSRSDPETGGRQESISSINPSSSESNHSTDTGKKGRGDGKPS